MISNVAFDYAARSSNRLKDQRTNRLNTDGVLPIAHIHAPFSSLFSLFLFLFLSLSSPLSLSVSSLCACVHRGAWTSAVQQLRAALHQLHQWETAAVLQPSYVRARAGRVWARRYRVDLHWFRHGSGTDDQSDREGKDDQSARDTDSIFWITRLWSNNAVLRAWVQLAHTEFAVVLPMLCTSCQCLLPRLCVYLIMYVSCSLYWWWYGSSAWKFRSRIFR